MEITGTAQAIQLPEVRGGDTEAHHRRFSRITDKGVMVEEVVEIRTEEAAEILTEEVVAIVEETHTAEEEAVTVEAIGIRIAVAEEEGEIKAMGKATATAAAVATAEEGTTEDGATELLGSRCIAFAFAFWQRAVASLVTQGAISEPMDSLDVCSFAASMLA